METSHYTHGVTSVMWSSLIASPHGLCISDRIAMLFLSFCLAGIPASCVEIEQAAFISVTTGFPLLHPLFEVGQGFSLLFFFFLLAWENF